MTSDVTQIAIVGCGFVADYYMSTLQAYPELRVRGIFDRHDARAEAFAGHHGLRRYGSYDSLLADDEVALVVNLTDPASHYDVSKAALQAGKHVYSEKPLAIDLSMASELVGLARTLDLQISSAPCSLLGEAAQTLWRAVREERVGTVRAVYAEMDEGLVHRMPFQHWKSEAGAPWPYQHEFTLGTVLEHAGYVVTWLPAIFGPVTTIRGFSDCIITDKAGVITSGTDFSVAVLHFESGVVARLTCSLIAPHDHSLRIIGDRGVLAADDTWFYGTDVSLRRSINIRQRHQWLPRKRIRLAGQPRTYRYRGTQQMDFARGVADLAEAVRTGRAPRLSAEYCLHTNEIVLALDQGLRQQSRYDMTTTFEPIDPMPWAR